MNNNNPKNRFWPSLMVAAVAGVFTPLMLHLVIIVTQATLYTIQNKPSAAGVIIFLTLLILVMTCMWFWLIFLAIDGYMDLVWGGKCPKCTRRHSLIQHEDNSYWHGAVEWCRVCDYRKIQYRLLENTHRRLQHHPFCSEKHVSGHCGECDKMNEVYPENVHRSEMVRTYFPHAVKES